VTKYRPAVTLAVGCDKRAVPSVTLKGVQDPRLRPPGATNVPSPLSHPHVALTTGWLRGFAKRSRRNRVRPKFVV